MGAGNSSLGCDAEGFTREEVSRLEKRFHKLDLDSSGSISVGEFLSVPELKENPLIQRVVAVMDSDLNGEVDFKEFVLGLAQFAVRERGGEGAPSAADRDEKRLEFIFRIYDMDRDGYISSGELFHVLKMMTGKNLTDSQLQQIVDKTINYLDKDADGRISYAEFKELIQNNGSLSQVTSMMSVDV